MPDLTCIDLAYFVAAASWSYLAFRRGNGAEGTGAEEHRAHVLSARKGGELLDHC
jgi:uncharacterized protein (DUF58 family)